MRQHPGTIAALIRAAEPLTPWQANLAKMMDLMALPAARFYVGGGVWRVLVVTGQEGDQARVSSLQVRDVIDRYYRGHHARPGPSSLLEGKRPPY